MKSKFLKNLKSIFKDYNKTEEVISSEENVTEYKIPFNKNTKMSIIEKDNIIYIEVFNKIDEKEIFEFSEEWEKGYIDYSDKNETFSRIIINNGQITYKFTIYYNGKIELRKREKFQEYMINNVIQEDCIYDTSLSFYFLSLYYHEMLHDHIRSTHTLCQFWINSRSYRRFGSSTSGLIEGTGDLPEDFYDLEKVNDFFEEFRKLDNEKIKSYLDKFAEENIDVKSFIRKIRL